MHLYSLLRNDSNCEKLFKINRNQLNHCTTDEQQKYSGWLRSQPFSLSELHLQVGPQSQLLGDRHGEDEIRDLSATHV